MTFKLNFAYTVLLLSNSFNSLKTGFLLKAFLRKVNQPQYNDNTVVLGF